MIFITDYIKNFEIEEEILGSNFSSYKEEQLDKSKIKVLLVWHAEINEITLQDFPNLHSIVRYGVGVDNIDIDFCRKNHIEVFNNPDYGVDEVSDTTIAMILALGRNIGKYNNKAKELIKEPNIENPWQENTDFSSIRFKEISLGLIGVGRIGSSVALKMKNIVRNLNFYDPYVPLGYEKVLGANRFNSLEKMLENSQIISFHVPLNEETKGMINRSFINKMQDNSILINTSRGGIIDSLDCLYSGLSSGKLSSLGLDVLPQEPPSLSKKEELLTSWIAENNELSDKIIINPHTSYYSPESYQEMREKAATMALNCLHKKQVDNKIV
tara:strand:- start:827 stop:1807 length:981 start_codon:yes stop_codon:yes gene_type:complete